MAELAKPTPVPTNTICSICGLPWESHKKRSPEVSDCIRLLKEALNVARANQYVYGWPQWTSATGIAYGTTISNS
jgi:hypothetical protein